MVEIKNVAVVGASGAVGAPILKALIDSGKFNITVLSRSSSKAVFPESVKVTPVEYDSLESVTAALKGQDAVVSTVGTDGLLGQSLIFDAAVAAGVKRFIPSEYGCDTLNPKTATLPVFGYKVATQKHIEAKVKSGADITYTYVITNPFLDWGLEYSFILNWKGGKPEVYDGGDQLFGATSLPSIGLAVVGVLSHYEETKNRAVHVQDIALSQNQLLKLAAKAAPNKKLEPVPAQVADLLKSSNEALARGEITPKVMVDYIYVAVFGQGYGSYREEKDLDNKLLGVPGKTPEDVEKMLEKVLA